ncbi:hypothetical protein H6P81_016770 [Aristolochia fimbriata]|uniref:Uncharacterized protein n=1 Tax=Aristolochia fimbriata TaxID=158543 RepID=A0AAV7E991_ARIFI|nr:hypothetical protein H6P81_016770 [Aristolochia fimbriata]
MDLNYTFGSSFISTGTTATPRLQTSKSMATHVNNIHHPSSSEHSQRSAQTSYRRAIWDYGSIQSLGSSTTTAQQYSMVASSDHHSFEKVFTINGRTQGDQLMEKLTRAVSDLIMLEQAKELRAQLQLVDALQHLGMGYIFEKEIKNVLDDTAERIIDGDLYTTALLFRKLRQHGYMVSQDVFKSFMDGEGFKSCLAEDIEGVLSLYEASHLAFEGETILEEARVFASKVLNMGDLQVLLPAAGALATKVQHALELPSQKWIAWLEARWYIDLYQHEPWAEPFVVDLSKLHFNMVQTTHQNDVKATSRWWRDVGLASRLRFARDRLMESFYWATGLVYEPQFSYCRRQLTKVAQFVATIDDVYDVYGTLDELQLFTEAIDRWDENSIEHLPEYMKMCLEALFKTLKTIREEAIKELDKDITPCLSKAWGDLCNSFLEEAKWYKQGRRPALQEYLENAWVSSSGPLQLTYAYYCLLLSPKATKCEFAGSLDKYMDLIQCSSMIFRLCNDLAVSKEELEGGDSISAIQLYMAEAGVTEESAREYIRNLINKYWKRLHEGSVSCFRLSKTFTNVIINLARNAETVYLHGDGFSAPDGHTEHSVTSLLVESLPDGDQMEFTSSTASLQNEVLLLGERLDSEC